MTKQTLQTHLTTITSIIAIVAAALGGFSWVTYAITSESRAIEARLSEKMDGFQHQLDGTNSRLDRLIEIQLQLASKTRR